MAYKPSLHVNQKKNLIISGVLKSPRISISISIEPNGTVEIVPSEPKAMTNKPLDTDIFTWEELDNFSGGSAQEISDLTVVEQTDDADSPRGSYSSESVLIT